MKLTDILSPESISLDMKAEGKRDALEELCRLLADAKKLPDPQALLQTLVDRESLGSTGIGQGVAIPHGKSPSVPAQAAALGLSKKGVDFDALDGEPVYILFLVAAPPEAAGPHLKALAKISRLLKDKPFRQALRDAVSVDDILKIIGREDDL
jgi:PTS system nitrogen regulatory IIA component